ncbi:protein N-terminal glutamine amidohydrolase [Schistocerca americana]|uniref:protein N-terminal glutamine amidohydrolase n=1 Tax=Schistocerca americana TaxID=7009 RepID=UPI001F4FAC05|nr:protein N-terminal glutamine amidohydrolase [Schistocerca americana]XP_047102682.1 protein N-terminal glutamine amidohydrolase [Schistocerca piceifrons]XP_049781785.1 protein N-terminal glutamine amidohydrolase isoform X1 [Schistocerca cancellata]XP_049781787.1 protein N-terminal glutamine amidohydrolase isoform X1 [Schistocerca cancellata]XP_049781788.1 protein N-terminal glutamine amidohydrolase isoform X1 [Schistocerca cancellata]XP_049781789.1 protein N-terminal glutamine amidohydrolase
MAEKVSNAARVQRQDTGVVTSSTKKPLLNLFPQRSDCKYTPSYCEENVWHLCHAVSNHHPKELQHCYVVFVSNDHRTVPLWRQKAGHEEEKLVIWDYHVLFLYTPDDRCLVYDLDSELPFPTYFHKYVTETFRTDHILKPDYFRYFRVVPAPVFLQHFASDRRHMKRLDGAWLKAPPDYPPITTPSCSHNLEEFINMDPTKGHGEVMNLTQLVRKFYQQT